MNLDVLKKNFNKNNGILKASKIIELGYTRNDINKLKDDKIIERVYHGYYRFCKTDISDVLYIKKILPNAIICMDSALFFYGYIDRTPLEWHVAVNKNTSKSKFKGGYPSLRPYFLRESTLNIGKTNKIIDGVKMNIYNKERVICDCFRFKNNIEAEIFTKAINSYIKDNDRSISTLIEYAKKLKIYKSLSAVMEVVINA